MTVPINSTEQMPVLFLCQQDLPLLYTLVLKEEKEKLNLFNGKPVAGSLKMTSLKIN
jgi:hypothetical protein